QLGTKTHWDSVYERELGNFADHGDIGEVWFGEVPVVKMTEWIEDNLARREAAVIDLGCGNGHFLFELSELGYSTLHGVDYSPASIALAQKIHTTMHPGASVTFATLDFMPFAPFANPPPAEYNTCFELAVDKGTFDAISLASGLGDTAQDGAPMGMLLITSCNWTEAELIEGFKEYFTFHSRKKYPTFKFGGVEGQQVVTVAFSKK
ncbi:S-adenosyl-L-methionine-dependent methyltransferase, partial [Chytriomyces sp. MP71]